VRDGSSSPPPGDTSRVFVVEQGGLIRVLEDGMLLPQPFLDIRDRVQIVTETGLLVLEIVRPWENHNGGMLQFGPDGDLYVSVRDGDSGVTEIWAYGLRNPWRFWIDAPTGDMFIGDVGLGAAEEIDLVRPHEKGLNFGWPCFEATTPFDAGARCDDPVRPLIAIPHEGGVCSVIGGVVWHDPRLTALEGRYLYGDFCTGRVTAVVENGSVTDSDDLGA
jgi:glucose/sorbosone dehydrogenase